MSLTQDDTTLAVSGNHGMVTPLGMYELPIAEFKFFGVKGVGHIVGKNYSRNLVCSAILSGYADPGVMQTALDTMDGYAGTLTGPLTSNIGGAVQTFQDCTFRGFERLRPPFLDGSGVHGWVQFGQLIWIQRTPN